MSQAGHRKITKEMLALLQTTAAKSLIWKISSAILESTFDGVINLVNILV